MTQIRLSQLLLEITKLPFNFTRFSIRSPKSGGVIGTKRKNASLPMACRRVVFGGAIGWI